MKRNITCTEYINSGDLEDVEVGGSFKKRITKKQKERIDAWVEALESGKYKRTTSFLKNDNKYCCLGVACKVAIDMGENIETKEIDDYTLFDGNEGVLTEKVKKMFGINDQTSFFLLNDDGFGFKRIANFIKDELKYVKVRKN